MTLKKERTENLIWLIILISFFLRFYRINQTFGFQGELGDNLLTVKNAIIGREIPLLGPPTSHPWLYFGPLFYWILIPWLRIFSYNAVSISYLGAFAGFLGVCLNFIVIKKIVSKQVALISSFLISISPYFISFSRSGRFMFWESVLFYILIYYLYKIYKGNIKYLFHLGFTFGVMINFHLTPLVLVIPILIIIIPKLGSFKEISKNLVKGFIGFIIPTLPFLIYDYKNNFSMSIKLVLWIPYRFLGFLGLVNKNSLSLNVAKETLFSIFEFFASNLTYEVNLLGIILAVIIVLYIFKNIKNSNFIWKVINYFTLFTIISFFIHTNPPSHYFVPILPIPIIVISLFLSDFLEKYRKKIFVFIFLIVIVFVDMHFLFSEKFYFKKTDELGTDFSVPYEMQRDVVKAIIKDSGRGKFLLGRVGPYDYYQDNFSQNYQYLLWYYGNEPLKDAKVGYIIYEGENNFPAKIENIIFKKDGLLAQKKKIHE